MHRLYYRPADANGPRSIRGCRSPGWLDELSLLENLCYGSAHPPATLEPVVWALCAALGLPAILFCTAAAGQPIQHVLPYLSRVDCAMMGLVRSLLAEPDVLLVHDFGLANDSLERIANVLTGLACGGLFERDTRANCRTVIWMAEPKTLAKANVTRILELTDDGLQIVRTGVAEHGQPSEQPVAASPQVSAVCDQWVAMRAKIDAVAPPKDPTLVPATKARPKAKATAEVTAPPSVSETPKTTDLLGQPEGGMAVTPEPRSPSWQRGDQVLPNTTPPRPSAHLPPLAPIQHPPQCADGNAPTPRQ